MKPLSQEMNDVLRGLALDTMTTSASLAAGKTLVALGNRGLLRWLKVGDYSVPSLTADGWAVARAISI